MCYNLYWSVIQELLGTNLASLEGEERKEEEGGEMRFGCSTSGWCEEWLVANEQDSVAAETDLTSPISRLASLTRPPWLVFQTFPANIFGLVAFIAPSKRYLDEVLHMKQSVFKGVMSSRKKFNDMIQMRTSYRVQQLWFCKRSIIDNKHISSASQFFKNLAKNCIWEG